MTILMMRLFYGIYFLGAALLVYHLVSLFIFQPESRNLKTLLVRLVLIPVWPFALFSHTGRDTLKNTLRRM